MGAFFGVLKNVYKILFPNVSGQPLMENPISYVRAQDYSISGELREGVQAKWTHALQSMVFLDLNIRRLLWPVIQKRMERMEASMKYTSCNLEKLKKEFPSWDLKKIFRAHDLFQVFEVDGDGLIEIAEMSLGLDNLGDTTSAKDRIPQLCIGDKDGTGSIDFEEFIQILNQQDIQSFSKPLAKTFLAVNNNLKFILWMSTVQQVRAGFF